MGCVLRFNHGILGRHGRFYLRFTIVGELRVVG